ncbi:hypothetical protein [Suttonella ornithocola]|uniref:Uncharacterized protein n=1 Tax=Suttonella ornithocola TaxID=279832 RepID=A0A380MLE3_9GAMM|nr:hypothetical protein [Suttonella ornithocola]SUO93465.1 Uncharacterised protein [Suttonella ornithocola]SUO97370.1 Uncharacterised protein [Suttonella ornithocola]
MNTTQKAQLIGVKQFKGDVDGNHYDSCKLRLLMPVPSDSDRECGYNVTEIQYGTSANYHQFKTLQFPVTVELDYELETRSGRINMSLKSVRPITK